MNCSSIIRFRRSCVAASVILLFAAQQSSAAPSVEDVKTTSPASSIKELRRQAAQNRRRIVFNDDGGQTQKRMTEPTAKNLIDQGTGAFAGTNVDTLVYCTKSVGLDLFTHFTKIGTVFTSRDGPFANSQVAALMEKGIDPLNVMVDFGKQNKIEVFWSMRMNDNHDAAKLDYGIASLRANRFKAAHPEFMFGTPTRKPKHGAWTALDFGRPEVRDRAFRLVEEVCRNYDVDGIELDFFRHPVYFRSNAGGKPATDEDRAKMTELVTRIRTMADEVGQSRGRPILIGMRLPDSAEYCRAIGLDLERWMADDLLDIYVPGSYYQINEWDYSVALSHKYGIKVYPSLDDMRSKDPASLAIRVTKEVYRARAVDAWRAGADGVYVFNCPDIFASDETLWHELGDPQAIAKLDKDYFGSYRGAMNASGGNLPFQPYLKLEILNPDSTREVKPGATATAKLYLAEDVASKTPPKLKLRLQLRGVEDASELRVSLNGRDLKQRASDDEGWFAWTPSISDLKSGPNKVEVSLSATAKRSAIWSDVMLEVRHD